MMDLWQLTIFKKVIELKSFSKAGKAVRLSQPTVSSHIKDLESHFGTQLVDRLARQAEPTKAGRLLYEYAVRLLALRDETEAAMSEFTGKIKGRLAVGGSTIPGGYLLPRVIGEFSKSYPEVRISLIVGDTSDILNKVLSGHIEIGIVGARSEDIRLEQVPLAEEDELRVVLPADHPWADRESLPLQELQSVPFIARESGSGTLRSLEQHLQEKDLSVRNFHIVAEMGSTEAVRQGIKNGVGLSVLSTIAVADDVRAGFLKTLTIEDMVLKRRFYLTSHKHRSPSPLCRAFTEFLQHEFRSSGPA